MSTIPQWLILALQKPVSHPNGMNVNRRQVFLMYDEFGNVIQANDFTEYVPYTQFHQSKPLTNSSNLLTFNNPVNVSELAHTALQTKSQKALWPTNRQPTEKSARTHIYSPTLLPPPVQRNVISPDTSPSPIASIPSPSLKDIPTLRDIHKQSRSTFRTSSHDSSDILDRGIKAKRSSVHRTQPSRTSILPPVEEEIPKPPLPDLPSKLKPSFRRVSYQLPFAYSPPGSNKSDNDDTYSRLYVPSTHYPEIKKPSDATYNKLREVIAEKAAEVSSSKKKQSYTSELHKELLSKVPKAKPIE